MRSGLELTGRYRLEEPLGRGGMGEVWRGVDQRLRRPVAVKILPLPIGTESIAVARFRREAEIAATLNHPGITTVFDIDEHQEGDERWLFLVMELLVGRDLRHLLTAHPQGLPIEQVVQLATQIAEALAAAHEHGVVHRDIKPANLFLLKNGRVKICDFGIARLANGTKITTTGSTAGTPLYMAPEQIQAGTVDHRTDLYAFGCLLYELLTGTTWVDADSNVGAIVYQHLQQQPTSPKSSRPQIPSRLNTLVLDLLAKRPDDRPQHAASVAECLHQLHDQPDQASDSQPPPVQVNDTPDTAPADRALPLRPQPNTSPPEQSGPASRRIARRTLVLGGLGAAGVAGISTAWLLQDADSTRHITLTGRTTAILTGHEDGVESVAFSPGGKTLATSSADGTIRLWDVTTGRTIAILTGHKDAVASVAFSPDGKTLATGSFDHTARLWNVAAHRTTAILTGHKYTVASVTFSPDGKTLATGSDDHTARLWKIK